MILHFLTTAITLTNYYCSTYDWTLVFLYNEFYSDFESFRNAIDGCLADSGKKYANELKTLMTLNFQSFENVQFLRYECYLGDFVLRSPSNTPYKFPPDATG